MDENLSSFSQRRGHMLMVLPTNLALVGEEIIVDGDFAQYLRLYLEHFETVVVACTAASKENFPTLEPLSAIPGNGHLKIIILPEPYREDRYILMRSRMRRLLTREIAEADFVVVAPHSAFDWPTLAAEICIKMGKPYNMEGDWNLQQVVKSNWQKMPFGINKLRKYLWSKYHDPKYFRAMRNSSVALLHGHDVFDAYRNIAPHPIMVNNICVTQEDRASPAQIEAKVKRVLAKNPLEIVYAGRAIAMKGPFEWLRTLQTLKWRGVAFRATYFGDGDLLAQMRSFVDDNMLTDVVTIAGRVERSKIFEKLWHADIFLFCHLTRESPRNVIEALATGTPIVGFRSPFYEQLVVERGGGAFVATGEVDALAELLETLDADRPLLAKLIVEAAHSGQLYDRTSAVLRRIALMKKYLLPA